MPRRPPPRRRKPVRVYAGQDHVTRVAERRQRFIEAGIRQFGTLGYLGTTMRSLCAEAGLSNRYFYESFANLEALLIACYVQSMQALQSRVVAAIQASAPDIDAMARASVRCFFEAVRDPAFARLTFAEVLGVSAAVDRTYLDNTQQFARVLLDAVRLAGAAPTLREDEQEMLGIATIGGFAYAATHWMHGGYTQPLERMVDTGVQLLRALAIGLGVPDGSGAAADAKHFGKKDF